MRKLFSSVQGTVTNYGWHKILRSDHRLLCVNFKHMWVLQSCYSQIFTIFFWANWTCAGTVHSAGTLPRLGMQNHALQEFLFLVMVGKNLRMRNRNLYMPFFGIEENGEINTLYFRNGRRHKWRQFLASTFWCTSGELISGENKNESKVIDLL